MGPTADFSQSNLAGTQAQQVQGHAVNSQYIFSWNNDGFRKMVLTDANGQQVKSGYVGENSATWTDVNTWTLTSGSFSYSISNFQCQGGEDCKDLDQSCSAWATQGYCAGRGSDQHMKDNCPLSCGFCTTEVCDRMHWYS